MRDSAFQLPRMGERRSSSSEFLVRLAQRSRTSIMDEGSSSTCLTAGSSGDHHARSPSKSRLRVRKIPLASLPSNLEDPVKHGRGRKGQSRKPAFLGLMLRDFGLTGYQRIPGLLPEARPTVPERAPSRLRQPVPATTREPLGTLCRHASLSSHFSLREPACCLEVVALWAKVILEGYPSIPVARGMARSSP